MKTQIKQPQPVSHTIQGKSKAANQAPLSTILQKYQTVAQRESFEDEDELLQGKFETAQREELDDDEEIQLQAKSENKTGLPDDLKSGVEAMSGYSMDDVRVHYNSSQPAQLNALAYAQGTDIHVAPGQEKHLPHEAWHVVQQKQGRVQPTMQLQGVNVNDNEGLEKEADVMGGMANYNHTCGCVVCVSQQKPLLTNFSNSISNYSPFQMINSPITIQYCKVDPSCPYSDPCPYHSPPHYQIHPLAVDQMIKPIGVTDFPSTEKRSSGVKVGDIGSYAYIQWKEQRADDLTGDHQPSGAAIKEALRINILKLKKGPLTRSQARNAYRRASTIVMPEEWHRKKSRTYGGRNTKFQINADALGLGTAASLDWLITVSELKNRGWSEDDIAEKWEEFHQKRFSFFQTGN